MFLLVSNDNELIGLDHEHQWKTKTPILENIRWSVFFVNTVGKQR